MKSLTEKLAQSTLRIEGFLGDTRKKTGTGFLYRIPSIDENGEKGQSFTLVTNEHVVSDCDSIMVTISVGQGGDTIGQGQLQTFKLMSLRQRITSHPSGADIVLINIQELFARDLDVIVLDRSIVQTNPEDLDYIEEILMVGYPQGIWDKRRNLPLMRRGTTASHPGLDWNGEKKFIVDLAVYPGSSGSPVFQYYRGIYRKKGSVNPMAGDLVKLLGVVSAVYNHSASGVEVKPAPVAVGVQVKVPSNLGIVISASEIVVLETEFLKKFNARYDPTVTSPPGASQ